MRLLRAEVWWFWHAILCFLSYKTGVIVGADWALLLIFLIGTWAHISWIRKASWSTGQAVLSVSMAHVPALAVSVFGFLALSGVLVNDMQIVALQLAAALFYPLADLAPDAYIVDSQAYLWVLSFCLGMHSIISIFCASINMRRNSNGNSYIEDAENMQTITNRQAKDIQAS